MPESVWNAFLRLSLVSCPVRLVLATRDTHVFHLDQLNARSGNPAQQFVDSRTGDVVGADAVVRGYDGGAGTHVPLSDDELGGLASEPPNVVDITQFCPHAQVDRARFDYTYYVYPDGQLASDVLDSLRLAMGRTNRDAIAYVRLDGRERIVLIEISGPGLFLTTLRPPRIMEPNEFVVRADSDVPVEMVDIAEGIITRRRRDGEANAMYDRYEDQLRALLEQKGGSTPPPTPPTAKPVPEPTLAAPVPSAPSLTS